LELGEFLKDFGFEMQEINLSEFTKIINEINIIILSSKGVRSWPSYIGENKLKRFGRNTCGHRVQKLVTLCLLTRITDIMTL
jgi:hypothetical protein